jgi:PilZ domain
MSAANKIPENFRQASQVPYPSSSNSKRKNYCFPRIHFANWSLPVAMATGANSLSGVDLPPMSAQNFQRPSSVPAAATDVADQRGVAERFPFSATAEIIDPASATRISARVSDISLTGCYLDVLNVLPPETQLSMLIRHSGRAFQAQGRVVYSTDGMGMGVVFVAPSTDAITVLKQWIAEIKGEPAPEAAAPIPTPPVHQPPENARGEIKVLGRLINTMMRKNLLSSEEGAALLAELLRG